MLRSDLFAVAERTGWKRGAPPTANQRVALRVALLAALNASALADAPRVFGDSGGRPMTLQDAVDALMEEIDAVRQ